MKFIGTLKERLDLTRAQAIHLAAINEFGPSLGGRTLVETLHNETSWSQVKCENIARVLQQQLRDTQ